MARKVQAYNKNLLRQFVTAPQFCGNDDQKNRCLEYILLHHCFALKQSMQAGKLIMIDHPLPYLPFFNRKDRKIKLIDVVEDFGLGHHLACVVKYVAYAGYKTSILKDLQKAVGHLDREIKRRQKVLNPFTPLLSKKPLFTIQEVLELWKLTPNLRKALFHILHSCQLPPPGLEKGLFPGRGSVRLSIKSKDFFYHTLPLVKAMRFLNLEIAELRTAAIEKGHRS